VIFLKIKAISEADRFIPLSLIAVIVDFSFVHVDPPGDFDKGNLVSRFSKHS